MVSEKVAANEEIRETQVRLGLGESRRLPFLCECADVECRDLLLLTPEEYAVARARPSRCIVAQGHPYEGRIIDRGPGYVITEV